MNSLQDFNYASFEEKCDVVTTSSDFLIMRLMGENKVYLYHTYDYFIEVSYSPRYKKVLEICALEKTAGLELYAPMISLADLNL